MTRVEVTLHSATGGVETTQADDAASALDFLRERLRAGSTSPNATIHLDIASEMVEDVLEWLAEAGF